MKPKQHTDGMVVTPVKHHRDKAKVRISLTLVKRMFKQAGIKPESDHAYNIYECGHIIDNDEDARVIKYFPEFAKQKNRSKRICPICWENLGEKHPLITKYKRCSCGAEHVSLRAQASVCCSSCSSSRRAARGDLPNSIDKHNDHLADPDRSYSCIHHDECVMKYIEYDAIPCKKCRRFTEASVK